MKNNRALHGFGLEAVESPPNMCAICTSFWPHRSNIMTVACTSFWPHRSNDGANERVKLTSKSSYGMICIHIFGELTSFRSCLVR